MVWGVEGNNRCREDLLKPLGLISYGGTSIEGGMCYTIYSIDKSKNIKFNVLFNQIENIKEIYSKIDSEYLRIYRKEKLKKINNKCQNLKKLNL
jgi:hypothetical protein